MDMGQEENWVQLPTRYWSQIQETYFTEITFYQGMRRGCVIMNIKSNRNIEDKIKKNNTVNK